MADRSQRDVLNAEWIKMFPKLIKQPCILNSISIDTDQFKRLGSTLKSHAHIFLPYQSTYIYKISDL